MKNVLERARTEGYAIPQFNINNLEWTRYILEACEEEKVQSFSVLAKVP